MTKLDSLDVLVCTDCAIVAANADYSGVPEGKHPLSKLEAGDWLVPGDSEAHFSHCPCFACGDPLAGDRLDAHLLTPSEED